MSPKKKSQSQPRLIILSAPSGAGKTTLCERLLKDFSKIKPSISTTTRQKRPSEKQSVHYYFVTIPEFKKLAKKGEFAEHFEVHGNYYGSSKEQIESRLTQGHHVLFDIDVQGALKLKEIYGNRALLVFIHPPSMKELKTRLFKRQGDTPEAIETRLRNAYNEVGWSKKFDYQIVNDDLNRAYQELKSIIGKECQ